MTAAAAAAHNALRSWTLSRQSVDALDATLVDTLCLVNLNIEEWHDRPERRAAIEVQLARSLQLKRRAIVLMARQRPRDTLELFLRCQRRMLPPLPGGGPNPKLRAVLPSLAISREQYAQLWRVWEECVQRIQLVR
jgi:hypothetical protein